MNIQQMMKQAQQMQERLQKQMAELKVEATAGAHVTVVMNGSKQIQSLRIDPESSRKTMSRCCRTSCWRGERRGAQVDEAMAQQMGGMLAGCASPAHGMTRLETLTRLVDELQRLPASGEERAAPGVPRAQDAARGRRPAVRGHARGEGARHLLLALPQHHRSGSCYYCTHHSRDRRLICVVEQPEK